MNIKVIYSGGPIPNSLIEQMTEIGITALIDEDIIEYNGRSINMGVFEQLKKRDGKNPQVAALHKIIIAKRQEKIEISDAVLVFNQKRIVTPDMQFEASIAWQHKKPIFLWESLTHQHEWFEMSESFGTLKIDADLMKLKSHVDLINTQNLEELNKRMEELTKSEEIKRRVREITTPPESKRFNLQTK